MNACSYEKMKRVITYCQFGHDNEQRQPDKVDGATEEGDDDAQHDERHVDIRATKPRARQLLAKLLTGDGREQAFDAQK